MDNVAKLYTPSNIPKRIRMKPGVSISGDPEWNHRRDHMILSDVKKYDDENHRLILKECKQYRFNSLPECAVAKWYAWAFCMKKLGIKVVEDMGRSPESVRKDPSFFEKRLDVEMKHKHVRIEERPPKFISVEQDLWQSGMYVYYNGDIVFFISNPIGVRAREGVIFLANRQQFMLVTNAKLE
jgi:hypothetical protein